VQLSLPTLHEIVVELKVGACVVEFLETLLLGPDTQLIDVGDKLFSEEEVGDITCVEQGVDVLQ
jgi:hypothetical protein